MDLLLLISAFSQTHSPVLPAEAPAVRALGPGAHISSRKVNAGCVKDPVIPHVTVAFVAFTSGYALPLRRTSRMSLSFVLIVLISLKDQTS